MPVVRIEGHAPCEPQASRTGRRLDLLRRGKETVRRCGESWLQSVRDAHPKKVMSRTETEVREKLRGLDPGSYIGGVGLGEEVQPLLPVGLGQCSSRSRSAISAHIEISASNYILPADSGMVDHRVLTPMDASR